MKNLSLTLTSQTAADPACWIRLQQELPAELATVEEAAEVIDKLFDLDPCTAVAEEAEAEDLPGLDEMLATAREVLAETLLEEKDTLCSEAGGSFSGKVRVYRSHQDRPYSLLLAGGEKRETVLGLVEQVVKTIVVDMASSVSLDLPGDQPVTASWQGPCYAESGRLDLAPSLTIGAGRIVWDGMVSGTLTVSYVLPYELVTIQATEPDCTVTALYHLSVDEIELQPPPADEQAEVLCQQIASSIDLLDDDGSQCTEAIAVEVRCQCTDEKSEDSYTRLVSVACLPGEAAGSTVNRGRVEVEYKKCSGQEDDVHDPEFYEATCCRPWPWFSGPYQRDLPRCRKKYGPYTQGEVTRDEIADLKKTYGPDIRFIPVGPDDGACGQTITVQDVNQRDCCDGVPELVWDSENSVEVIDTNGDVYITGGKLSILKRWQVRGHGFYTDSAHTKKDAVTGGNRLRIYVSDEACGTAAVYVTDGCSSASGMVRSIMGQWVAIDPATAPETDVNATAIVSLSSPPALCSARSVVRIEAVTGKYRYRQTYLWSYDTVSFHTSAYLSPCSCSSVSSDWQAGAAVIGAYHNMPTGELQLINPFSGAQLLPMDNIFVWQGATSNPSVPGKQSDNMGLGMSKHCHLKSDYFGHLVWSCATNGGTLFANGGNSHCPDTNPTAEVWEC